MQHPAIGMEDLEVCIVWNRCRRRRWPEGRELVFTPEETRKRRNVLLHCWAGSGWRDGPGGRMKVEPGSCFWSRPGWSYRAGQTPDDPLGITAIHFDLMDRAGGWVEPARVVVPSERLTCRHPAHGHGAANPARRRRRGRAEPHWAVASLRGRSRRQRAARCTVRPVCSRGMRWGPVLALGLLRPTP
jgi:hypothetical protein